MGSEQTNRSTLAAIRLSAVAIYGYSIYYQQVNNTLPVKKPFGKLKYLTYWNLLLQFTYFSLVTLATVSKSKVATKLIDFLFFALAFPMALIVSSSFWSIYAIDRELIFPVVLEKYYPTWLNHSTHTLVFVYMVAELYFAKHQIPSTKPALVALFGVNFIYVLWLNYIALFHDFWVYPFLAALNWPQRFVFFVVSSVFGFSFFFLGTGINSLFHGKAKSIKSKRSKRA